MLDFLERKPRTSPRVGHGIAFSKDVIQAQLRGEIDSITLKELKRSREAIRKRRKNY